MKNINTKKIWMAIAIFAAFLAIFVVLEYILYSTGLLRAYIEFWNKVLGGAYMEYIQWFYSKWYMIAAGLSISFLGMAFVSYAISDEICTSKE